MLDIAREFGTPTYIYSRRTFVDHFRKLDEAFREVEHLVCYSVKANGNLAVLKILEGEGAGFDVVSAGELYRALRIGASPEKIVFAGVGKTPQEIGFAIDQGVHMFNVESAAELWTIHALARTKNKVVQVALRVNPDVAATTHRHLQTGKQENKFGIAIPRARELAARMHELPGVRLTGLHVHIGSQLTDTAPIRQALARMADLVGELRAQGHPIANLNIGGGLGIHYQGREGLPAQVFADAVLPLVQPLGCRIILEPGRFIMGNAGILLTRVTYVKSGERRRFVITDAGMTDLLRPSLYEAYHLIWPVLSDEDGRAHREDAGEAVCDVVGPICESADFLALERRLPRIAPGDYLAVFSAGAYGHVLSSNYNARPRSPEVLVEGDTFRVVRRRETYEDLVRDEILYY